MNKLISLLLTEMDREAVVTRKMLSRVPMDKLDWAPHEKSMKMGPLATHIAELPGWVDMAIHTDELNFAGMDWTPTVVTTNEDLVAIHEENFAKGRKALEGAENVDFDKEWVLRTGDHIHSRDSKYEVIRMAYCQIVHHRAQLGVYLRLLNVPIPGTYGPSADDTAF